MSQGGTSRVETGLKLGSSRVNAASNRTQPIGSSRGQPWFKNGSRSQPGLKQGSTIAQPWLKIGLIMAQAQLSHGSRWA